MYPVYILCVPEECVAVDHGNAPPEGVVDACRAEVLLRIAGVTGVARDRVHLIGEIVHLGRDAWVQLVVRNDVQRETILPPSIV